MRYSFKRGTDRNVRAKSTVSVYQQSIFSAKLLSEIYDDTLIINIDENSFSRSVKSNYSWLPIRQSSDIINVSSQGRISLTWGLMINGHWIWLMSQDTTTIQEFCVFLHILRMFVDKTFCLGGCRAWSY